jgi:hypothetical protein
MTLTLVPTGARAALPAFGLLLALTGGSVVVHADEEDATATLESAETCSNASLHGTYGFSFHRVNLNLMGHAPQSSPAWASRRSTAMERSPAGAS